MPLRRTLLPLMLRLGERRDIIFASRPTDAASLAFLLLGVAAFAAEVLIALRNDALNLPRVFLGVGLDILRLPMINLPEGDAAKKEGRSCDGPN